MRATLQSLHNIERFAFDVVKRKLITKSTPIDNRKRSPYNPGDMPAMTSRVRQWRHFMRSRSLRAILVTIFLLLSAAGPSPARQTSASSPAAPSTVAPGAPQQVGVRWAFYVTYKPDSWTSLQANARHLNYVSPWFYNLNPSAQITGTNQPQVSA